MKTIIRLLTLLAILPFVFLTPAIAGDSVREKIGKNAKMYQQLQAAVQAAMALCQRYEPQNMPQLAQMMGVQGGGMPLPTGAGPVGEVSGEAEETERKTTSGGMGDDTRTRNARERAANIGQPEG